MNNIRQLTNFSTEVTSAETTNLQIYIENQGYINKTYYILPLSILTGSNSQAINKIGYVCEPKAIGIPIFIKTDTLREIEIGKTGMFEIMPETFQNINDNRAEEQDCTPKITQIMVPKDIQFKLDYVFAIS